ncbi:hypothetical protein B0H13DRAFT_2394635 [Mycena leptocephala]|nr:hypothetical protein B0H13DRAFT_2394635 [Mycena leptocephala]
MAPIPAMNHYKKIQEEMDKQQAEAAKWAAEAAASPGANVINAQPINWRLVLIVFGLIALGIALAIGLTSLGRRVLKSWHGTRNADVEASLPPVVFAPPNLAKPPHAATHERILHPISYYDRGYISQADLIAGKGRRRPS